MVRPFGRESGFGQERTEGNLVRGLTLDVVVAGLLLAGIVQWTGGNKPRTKSEREAPRVALAETGRGTYGTLYVPAP